MASLAVALKNLGVKISGSDTKDVFFTDELLRLNKIPFFTDFSEKNLPRDADLIIASTAYNDKNNIEVLSAKDSGLPFAVYPEVLGALSAFEESVAICGSHGKTTTSAMLGFIMQRSGTNPHLVVGSMIPQLATYVPRGAGPLIFEADEYQNKFLYYRPKHIILTNIDYDHPDFFPTKKSYFETFKNFTSRLSPSGTLVYWADDRETKKLLPLVRAKKLSYSFGNGANYQIKDTRHLSNGYFFSLFSATSRSTKKIGDFGLSVFGDHNILNATAAIIMALELGIPVKKIAKLLKEFKGTKRRLEILKKTKINGSPCIIIDDYGHHPTEIRAIIKTLGEIYPRHKLVCVFQPHTFSRTEALFGDFAKSFKGVDYVLLLDIYKSAREQAGKISSADLAKSISGAKAFYTPTLDNVFVQIKKLVKKPSIILTLGAGDAWKLVNYY